MNASVNRPGQRTKKIYGVAIAAMALFVILTSVAMLLYPGGTYQEPTAGGYDFFRNTFSELGHTTGYRDQPKVASFLLFLLATVAGGLGMLVFFLAESKEALRYGASRAVAGSAGVLGALVAMSFIAIGLIPADVAFRIHFLFVYVAFTLLAPLMLLLLRAWISVRFAAARRVRITSYLVFLVVVVFYLVLIYIGPPLYTDGGRVVQATGQKIVVYAALASLGTVSIGIYRRAGKQ